MAGSKWTSCLSIDVQVLTYVVTRHNLSTFSALFMMPAVAIFAFSVGWGLWFLKRWARNAVIITSAVTVVLWLRRFSVDWVLGATTRKTAQGRQSVYVVVTIDAVILGCLAFYPDLAKAFGDD